MKTIRIHNIFSKKQIEIKTRLLYSQWLPSFRWSFPPISVGLPPHVVANGTQRLAFCRSARSRCFGARASVVLQAQQTFRRGGGPVGLRLLFGLVHHCCMRPRMKECSPGHLDVAGGQEQLCIPPPLTILGKDVVGELCEDLSLLLQRWPASSCRSWSCRGNPSWQQC